MNTRLSRVLAAIGLLTSAVAATTFASANAAPKATIVSVSSSSPDGTYKVGDTVRITVRFSATIEFGGGVLMLETGPSDRGAQCGQYSGLPSPIRDQEVDCSYVVRIGDRSSDLDVQSTDSFLTGGIATTSNGVDVDMTLPRQGAIGSLSANSNIVVDGSGVDEQWPAPLTAIRGVHGFTLSEDRRENVSYAGVAVQGRDVTRFCTDVAVGDCSGKSVQFRSVLPMCGLATQLDCIESVTAESDRVPKEVGEFTQVFPAKGNYDFAGSASRKIPPGTTSSVLKFSTFPFTASDGNLADRYLVTAAISGSNSADDKQIARSLFASITPITFGDTYCDERFQGGYTEGQVGFSCMDGPNTANMADQDRSIRCVVSDVIDGNKDGHINASSPETNDRAFCALKQPFPDGVRFTLKIRLTSEPSGWLHGRMDEPSITFDTTETKSDVTISAGPVKVPAYVGVASYGSLPKSLQTYFDDLCSKERCGARFPDIQMGAPASVRNPVDDNPKPFSAAAFRIISQWREFQNDTANAMVSFWNVRTLTSDEMGTASSCLADKRGVTGVVTTNSTAYEQGPPAFDPASKTLKYEVAAPHYEKDGKTEFKGVYNLIVREDVAECLYGFSNAFAAPAPPEEFADESDPDVYVEEEPYTDEEFYAEEYPEFEEEYVDTDDGSYEMYEDVEYEEVSLEEYVEEEEDLNLTEDVSDSGAVVEEEEVFEETVVASIDASIITELQKAATANTAIELADGWFKFSATNFTFSKPTVKVNFAATPSKVLACVAGSTVRYVKSIRSQCPSGTSVAKTAYCVKGKAVDAVVGANPKCPKGAKAAKTLKCAKGDDARLVVALAPKCAKGWSKVNSYICVKGNIARRVSAVQVKCANGFALAKQIVCVKGRASTTVTAVKPACPKGYRARK